MKTDQYGRTTINTDEAIDILLKGSRVQGAFLTDLDEIDRYNNNSAKVYGNKTALPIYENINDLTVDEYYQHLSTQWKIPDKYKNINMKDYLLAKCKTDIEIQRVESELVLYEERGLIPLLQFTVYLVDYMRENDHLWGVGRGSSVSSYCLYLTGIHRINSIRYNLDVTEFLK